MQAPPEFKSTKRTTGRFDKVAVALGVAILLVFAGGLFALRSLADRYSRAERAADEFVQTTRSAAQLWGSVADLYAAGIEPPPFGATGTAADSERREARILRAREAYRRSFSQVEEEFSHLPHANDRQVLLDDLGGLAAPVHEMIEQIDRLARPGRTGFDAADRAWLNAQLRSIGERFDLARSASQRLSEDSGQVLRALRGAHDDVSRSMLRSLYIAAGMLLFLVLAAALHFRSRSIRERRMLAEKEVLLGQMREAEVRYRSIFNNAVEGIFQTTPDGQLTTANQSLARMYGYDSPEQLIRRVTDIGTQLYVESSQRAALLDALKTSNAVKNYEFEVVRADGRTIWVREHVRAVRDAAGQLIALEGTVEDVSEVWWGEQLRRLQYAIARELGEAATVDEALPAILRSICETLGWSLGVVWNVDAGMRVLRRATLWKQEGIEVADFEAALDGVRVCRGEGLAGKVWVGGEPRWIADLKEVTTCATAQLALSCGFSSAIALAIQVDGGVVHVLEFFCRKITQPDSELFQTLGAIAAQLGHLIERKRAEEALRESETRKAAILDSALDCIITFDLDGRIIEFNPAAARAFASGQEEVLGRDVSELIFPDLPVDGGQRGLALYQVARTGSAARRRELVATRADGSTFPVEVAISRTVIDELPMFTAFLRDISERKEAERLTSELALVVANSNDAIIACTLEGVIRSWNLGAERIFGYAADEAIGRPLPMLIPTDRLDELPQTITAIKRGDSMANYETVRLRKDGRRISVSLTDSPIRGDGGAIIGLSLIARDITERKRLEEDLLQSQKMDAVGRLAGGIAHDFNNILTAILGYSDLIIGQIDERQWMYKSLVEIRKAADFASSLTNQLLAFSRRQPLYPRVFCINDSVSTMEKMLRRVIGEDVRIVTQLGAEIGRLKADPNQLEQVLLNLCVNARDAMPKGGTLTIVTADVTYFPDEFLSVSEMPAGDYVKLIVSDTGAGIAPEVRKHVFEPFFTTKQKGNGTGLGLATCYGIVKQSGGYISVDSTEGVGTTFSIYLPRVDESGEKSSARKEVGELVGGNETILYVEDEITVRSLTAHVLRRLGYTVLEAGDGTQARDVAEGHSGGRIDLLFSDVVLPDSGGRNLADWMRARNDGTRILFTSGYTEQAILKRHGLDSSTAFLQKPFTPADLAKKVREVVDGTFDGNL